jgi:hypothetical protein
VTPTDDIDDPTWNDIFDRDDEIKRLEGVIKVRDESLDVFSDLVVFLKVQVQLAPCLVSRPGEGTYECRVEKLCRVCEWRRDVHRELVQTWKIEDGIW